MSEAKVPEDYTQTRAEFGQRAINTARAVQVILGELINGYAVLNNFVPPGGHGTTTGSGTQNKGSGTSSDADRQSPEAFDPHDPYFLRDAIKALDELIAVTEKRYL